MTFDVFCNECGKRWGADTMFSVCPECGEERNIDAVDMIETVPNEAVVRGYGEALEDVMLSAALTLDRPLTGVLKRTLTAQAERLTRWTGELKRRGLPILEA